MPNNNSHSNHGNAKNIHGSGGQPWENVSLTKEEILELLDNDKLTCERFLSIDPSTLTADRKKTYELIVKTLKISKTIKNKE